MLPGHVHCHVRSEHVGICRALLGMGLWQSGAAQGPSPWPGRQGLPIFSEDRTVSLLVGRRGGGRTGRTDTLFTGGQISHYVCSCGEHSCHFLGDAKYVSKTRVSTAMQGMLLMLFLRMIFQDLLNWKGISTYGGRNNKKTCQVTRP